MNPNHDPLKALFLNGEAEETDTGEETWNFEMELDSSLTEGVELLQEAHEAINRLYQKTNKRGKLMRQPRRADSWQ